MKKQLLFIAVLLCACLAGSCKDDDPAAPDSLYMHSTSGTVEAAAGTQSVTIYTTCGWNDNESLWIDWGIITDNSIQSVWTESEETAFLQ